MKRLILCRHAKSSWRYPIEDIYRPLNRRGLQQAPAMARDFRASPDLVLCSPATRAWSTALCYFNEHQWHYQRLTMVPELHEASLEILLEILADIGADISTVMLFGHNPGLNELIDYLVKPEAPLPNLVTAARAELQVAVTTWTELGPGCAVLEGWYTPQTLHHKNRDKS